MKKYIVKPEYQDEFYGRCDVEYIEQCQERGIPQEDIDHLIREWGEDAVMEMLEEL